MTWTQKTKYFNTKKVNYNNKAYDSKFEADYGATLELRKRSGEIEGFDTHIRIPLIVNEYTVCDYYIDFIIYHKDGTEEYVETKGWATPVFKLKWKIFCALYEDDPQKKITLIMQGKNYKPRLRKTRKPL